MMLTPASVCAYEWMKMRAIVSLNANSYANVGI
jgi:hypothetical protein